MSEKSIESLLEKLDLQRNTSIGMDLEGYSEIEQRLGKAKLESLEGELLHTIARHVIDLEKEMARMKRSGKVPDDNSPYFAGE